MGPRITTWNVNGIRNPFGFQPWRDRRTFEAMFDILEADIVVFQETKIQRKDLRDDMVLVSGWDSYFSLPKHKKGYSGVVIYTRNSTCAPIRAEEGITGILTPPNSSTSFKDLPESEQIGGYPSPSQLALSEIDAATLDSEGRCVILEFPAFVILGVYNPANSAGTRDEFKIGFQNVLDARVRNLVALGKRVIVTGDLNISREEIDTANAENSMRKNGMAGEEYCSTPSRRLFNQLLVGGKVFGERDEGREKPVMWDICRGFHPGRKGMFTHWEQKVNARPGNYGARIDYVLCRADMKDWFEDSNIQEGLMGSDHCPVYATLKDRVTIDGVELDVRDVMNPPGMFKDGQRQQEYSTKNLLPLSGKLIKEFDGRRNIRDMFRKPSLSTSHSSMVSTPQATVSDALNTDIAIAVATPIAEADDASSASTSQDVPTKTLPAPETTTMAKPGVSKRSQKADAAAPPAKRSKSGSTPVATSTNAAGKGQQSLRGFFKPNTAPSNGLDGVSEEGKPTSASLLRDASESAELATDDSQTFPAITTPPRIVEEDEFQSRPNGAHSLSKQTSPTTPNSRTATTRPVPSPLAEDDLIDPIVSKESWSKLFTKPAAPRCESHNEPCISLLTKKSGINCGRSFWMCPRPLGPTGAKERGTQWRCMTFIWCSDWNGSVT